MRLRPVADYVIVKALSDEEVSASGIILPDTIHKEPSDRGVVFAVGPGRPLDNGHIVKPEVEPGQKVVYKTYAPAEIKVDGEEYLVIRASEIVAVIE